MVGSDHGYHLARPRGPECGVRVAATADAARVRLSAGRGYEGVAIYMTADEADRLAVDLGLAAADARRHGATPRRRSR